MSTGIINRDTIAQQVENYNIAMKDIEAGFELLTAGHKRLVETFGSKHGSFYPINRNGRTNVEATHKRLHREAWRALIGQLQLNKILSNKRMKEISKTLEEGELPPIETDAIYEALKNIALNLNGLAMECVQESFEALRLYGDRYKTNKRWKVGKRVILTGYVHRYWETSNWDISYMYMQNVLMLDRTFHFLDGKLLANENSYNSPLVDSIRSTAESVGQTEYFEWKAYKNGNLHLKFRREDLLATFNQYGGRANELGSGNKLF